MPVGVLIGLGILLFAGAIGFLFWKDPGSASKDPHVEAELQPGNSPAVEIPGVMRLLYHDLGGAIQLSIVSKSNPILSVDVNQDHIADKGDVSYSPLPGDHACVAAMGSADCSNIGTSAKVQVKQSDEEKTVTWTISKTELGSGKQFADVVIRTFHENTQQGDYYPAAPFQKVYRLMFAQAIAEQGPPYSPPPAPIPASEKAPPPTRDTSPHIATAHIQENPSQFPPVIPQFEAIPDSLQAGASTRLKWKVQGTISLVTISPGVGVVASQGEREVSPSATTRYLLTATGPKGANSRELTVTVAGPAPPVIASFSSSASTVTPGSVVRLRWNVTGQTNAVRIEPVGSGLPASGFRDVIVAQTTNYVLTAEGPGGSVTSSSIVHTAPQGQR